MDLVWREFATGVVSVSLVQGLRKALRALTFPYRRWPRTSRGLSGLVVLLVLLVIGSNAYILLTYGGDSTSDVAEVPAAQVAIVPGALVQPNGKMSVMLGDRVKDAYRL